MFDRLLEEEYDERVKKETALLTSHYQNPPQYYSKRYIGIINTTNRFIQYSKCNNIKVLYNYVCINYI